LTWPELKVLPHGHSYILLAQYAYDWVLEDGLWRRLIVPKGFVSEGSVPRVAWSLLDPTDITEGAVLHDFPYRHGGHLPVGSYLVDGRPCTDPWTRKDADRLFGRVNREAGVVRWKRRAAYLAVRAFGRRPWMRGLALAEAAMARGEVAA
jgi:hypothetical protein